MSPGGHLATQMTGMYKQNDVGPSCRPTVYSFLVSRCINSCQQENQSQDSQCKTESTLLEILIILFYFGRGFGSLENAKKILKSTKLQN